MTLILAAMTVEAATIARTSSPQKYAKADDASDHPDRKVYSLDWLALKESCEDHVEKGNDGHQWETMLAIRDKLEEYGA